MARERKAAPDQRERDAAVAERTRNVLIDAGAGTGKTTILVDRLIEMVAPTGDAPGVPIERVAAITFTRKAAGELRLKIRERLLEELAQPALPAEREARLRDALAGLDTAHVGTIHSFADRLLRLRPVEAELSPSYEIAEDDELLVHETFELMLHSAQSGTLAAELADTRAADRHAEAASTVLFALQVGLPAESVEKEWGRLHGLDALVEGFIRQRDVPPPDDAPASFDAVAFHAVAGEFVQAATPLSGTSVGASWLRGFAERLRRLRTQHDPAVLFAEIKQQLDRAPKNDARKRDQFEGDNVAWQVWMAFMEGRGRALPLRTELTAPLYRWMATRLARLFPVVVAVYEKVKARRQQLDQLDLLVKLRDLLAENLAARAEYQRLFDHVFVDEFQDTDPLQAEIVLFLCEREPVAAKWQDVVLRPGSLTLVGDPKQSIYRFRRADVAMYDEVLNVVARGPHLRVTLAANFRSAPPLIAWLNNRFDRILGHSPDGQPFDAATGRVFQQPLLPGREGASAAPVHVLPFDFADAAKHNADEYRKLEGQALARYLRWLVEKSDVVITDPVDGRTRRVGYGDIAILAVSTWHLPLLFPWLDAEGIPYASRGGTLFLEDPLHRQLLLGLRALADRDDGVAEAALLRPPFFALDPADLVRERADRLAGREPGDAGSRRVREARELVTELRRHRFERPPGSTARDLLDRTAFARAVATGANGAQRLARLRELCLLLEQRAAADGLDYDAATAELRKWVEKPIQVDPPHPVASEAVQVLTVHQAKGLEFPVVVVWDGRGEWRTANTTSAWRVDRNRRGWLMGLNGLAWEEPTGLALRQTEHTYLDAERCRVIYVAATRARDLLVVPKAGTPMAGKHVCGDLLDGADPALVRELATYRARTGCAWASEPGPGAEPERADADAVERDVAERWSAAAVDSARPRFKPASVTGEARTAAGADEPEPPPRKPRPSRFGPTFGTVVHEAIALVYRNPGVPPEEAVRRAADHVGLTEHLDDAIGDVSRTLETLRAEGLLRPLGPDLQLEYPVAGVTEDGLLVTGYIDLVAVTPDAFILLDFKTDTPPEGEVAQVFSHYVSQTATYARLLGSSGLAGTRLESGLLFTGKGRVASRVMWKSEARSSGIVADVTR